MLMSTTSKKLSCLRYLHVTAFPNRQAFVPTARLTIQYPCQYNTQLAQQNTTIYTILLKLKVLVCRSVF